MKHNPLHYFYKGLHQLFNAFLILGIIFQALIFSIEINGYEIPVPKFVLSKIENFLAENNLSYEADSIKLKLTGEINCENLQLKYSQFLEPIFTCDQLSLNLSLFSFILGRFNPEEILVKNATVFCPPSLTPTGLNEPLIKNLFGAISLGRKYIQLQQLDFDFQNISLIAEGAWSKKSRSFNPLNFKSTNKPVDSIILDYLSMAQKLIEMKDHFSNFHKPILAIHISENESETILLDFQINASKCELKNLKLESINIRSKLAFDQTFNFIKPIVISARNVNWNEKFSANMLNIQAFAEFNQIDTLPIINDLHASLNNVAYQDAMLNSLEFKCNLFNRNEIPGQIATVNNNSWLLAKGIFNSSTKNIDADIKGDAKTTELLTLASQLTKQKISEDIINGNVNWTGKISANVKEKLEIKNSELIISSQDLSFNQINSDRVYAELNINPEKLNITYINANLGNNHAKGSIYHNFKSQDYRYLLAGSLKPEFLNPYFGEWWKELLDHFTFSTSSPFANLDIQGNLLTPEKWLVYGELFAKNFIYDTVPIAKLNLKINSSQSILELIDLNLNSNTGQLEAYTKFEYAPIPNQNKIVYIFVNGQSSLALKELDSIIGLPQIHNIIQKFSSNNSPQISAKGNIYENDPNKTFLKILFNQNTPISYFNVPFDHMDFTVDYTPNYVAVNNINVEFAEGIGEGHLQIESYPNTPPQLTADIHLMGVKQEIAVNHLQKLWLTEPMNAKANDYGGLLTLDLNATGTLGDWTSFIGAGKVSITQANLARINLFGILSQILSFTPLGLGSFHLTDATSDFLVQKNAIHFPNIHIFGSTASIDGKGNFYLDTQNLEFMLDISPLNKKGIPILSQMMLVLAPITQSFQMKLGGTLQNPKWETLLTPLGLGKTKGPELPQN